MKFYTQKRLVWTVCFAILTVISGYAAARAENKLILRAEADASGRGGIINLRTATPLSLTIYPERGQARVKLDKYSELVPGSAKPLSYTAPGGKFSAQLLYFAPQENNVSVKVTIFIRDVKGYENQFTGTVDLAPLPKGTTTSQPPQPAVQSSHIPFQPPLRIGFPALKDSPCGGKLKLTVPFNRDYAALFDPRGKARVEVRFLGNKGAQLIKNQDIDYSLTEGVLQSEIDFVRHQSETVSFTLLFHVAKKDRTEALFQKEDSISPPAASQKEACKQPAEEFKLDIINVAPTWEMGTLHRLTIKLKANQAREILGIITDSKAGTVQHLPSLNVGPEEQQFILTASLSDNTSLKFIDSKNGRAVGDARPLHALREKEPRSWPDLRSVALVIIVFIALLSLLFVAYLPLRKVRQSVRAQELNPRGLQERIDRLPPPSGYHGDHSEVLRSLNGTVSKAVSEIRSEVDNRDSSTRREIIDFIEKLVGSVQELGEITQWIQSRAQKEDNQGHLPSAVAADIRSAEAMLLAVVNDCLARQTFSRADLQAAAAALGMETQFFDLRKITDNLKDPTLLDYRFDPVDSGAWVFANTPAGDFFALPFDSRALTGSVLTLLKRMFNGTEMVDDNPRLQLAWRAARFRRTQGGANLFRLINQGVLQISNQPAPNMQPPPHLSDIARRSAYNPPSAPQSLFAILGLYLKYINQDIEKAKGKIEALSRQSVGNSIDSEKLSPQFRAVPENFINQIKAINGQVSDLQEEVARLTNSAVSKSRIEGLEARITKVEKSDGISKALSSRRRQDQEPPSDTMQKTNIFEPHGKTDTADVVDEVGAPVVGHSITWQAIDQNLISGSREEAPSNTLKGQEETPGSESESVEAVSAEQPEVSVVIVSLADDPAPKKDIPQLASQRIDESPPQQKKMTMELLRLPDRWEVWKRVLTEVAESEGGSSVQLSVRDYVRRLQLLLDSLHHHGQPADIVHLSQESDGFSLHDVEIDSAGDISCVRCGPLAGNQPFQLTIATGESSASQRILLPPGRIAVTEYYSGYQGLIEDVTPSGVVEATPSQQPAELRQVNGDRNRRYTVVRKMICRT